MYTWSGFVFKICPDQISFHDWKNPCFFFFLTNVSLILSKRNWYASHKKTVFLDVHGKKKFFIWRNTFSLGWNYFHLPKLNEKRPNIHLPALQIRHLSCITENWRWDKFFHLLLFRMIFFLEKLPWARRSLMFKASKTIFEVSTIEAPFMFKRIVQKPR